MSTPLTLMFVHAHPDDEAIGTGGSMARYAAEGVRTVLVMATLGEEGEIVTPELNTPEIQARLAEVRREELGQAITILGVNELEFLGYRDSGMAGRPSNDHPECFHTADLELATGRLVKLVRTYRPHVLVTYNEWGGYGHPDHIACNKVTVAAFVAAGDPQWYPEAGEAWAPLKLYYINRSRSQMQRMWEMMRERGIKTPLDNPQYDIARYTVPDEQITSEVMITDYIPQKLESIKVHRTQIGPDGPWALIPEDIGREMFSREYYTLVDSRVALPEIDGREQDLFTGIR